MANQFIPTINVPEFNRDTPDIQNKCKYGWVLPDRCRYNPRLGCECGAYPPLNIITVDNFK